MHLHCDRGCCGQQEFVEVERMECGVSSSCCFFRGPSEIVHLNFHRAVFLFVASFDRVVLEFRNCEEVDVNLSND